MQSQEDQVDTKPVLTKQQVAKAALETMNAAMTALDAMNIDEAKSIITKYIEENTPKPRSARKSNQASLDAREIGRQRSRFKGRKD